MYPPRCLLCARSYAWNFAWAFVDTVVGQESANGGAIQTSIILATGEPLVIHDRAVEGLATPFSNAVWTGVATFLFSMVGLRLAPSAPSSA